jgi:hypothetical protein
MVKKSKNNLKQTLASQLVDAASENIAKCLALHGKCAIEIVWDIQPKGSKEFIGTQPVTFGSVRITSGVSKKHKTFNETEKFSYLS